MVWCCPRVYQQIIQAKEVERASVHHAVRLHASHYTPTALRRSAKVAVTYGDATLVLDFIEQVLRLHETAYASASNLRRYLVRVYSAIRRTVLHPGYQLLKRYERIEIIRCTHAIILAFFTMSQCAHAFEQIGRVLCIGNQNITGVTCAPGLDRQIQTVYEHGRTLGLFTDNKSLWYMVAFARNCFGAFLSTRYARSLKVAYNPVRHVENLSGQFFRQALGHGLMLQSIYTGTPTTGGALAPEMHAILQAIENRHDFSEDELRRDPFPYLVWSFVNLQDITDPVENARTKAIMEAAEHYPRAFSVCTITQDSEFFRAHERTTSAPRHHFGLQLREQFHRELHHPSNYTLADRCSDRGGGYCFLRLPCTQETWRALCDDILSTAYTLIDTASGRGEHEDIELCMAYKELVHLGIIYAWHLARAKQLADAQLHGTILASETCKECIDRGGRVQAELAWALGVDDHHVLEALYARSLLTRYRLILQDRLEPFRCLAKVVAQRTCCDFLCRYLPERLGLPPTATAQRAV